jgi:hypothetical protein
MRYPLLFSLLTAACCAPRADTRRDPPVVAPPQPAPKQREPIRFTESGCVVGGVEYGPDRAFPYEGRLCGCYEGQLSCNELSEARCFRDGKWYAEGLAVSLSNRLQTCGCSRAPVWTCWERRLPLEECPKVELLRVVRFELGSSALSADAQQLVEGVANELKRNPDVRATLEAHADPNEEPRASFTALRRGEAVRTALVKLGVNPRRIDIMNLGTKPVPIPPQLRIPSCSDTSAFNPGPFIAINLGKADDPTFIERRKQLIRASEDVNRKETP